MEFKSVNWQMGNGGCCNRSGSGNKTQGMQGNRGNQPPRQEMGGQNFLEAQMGMNVRINRGGPESLDGRLIGVQKGYVVLRNSTGTVYVNSSHVRSVTDLPTQSSRGMSQAQFIKADGFNGVLQALTRKFVQINWGGPEKIEGFIAQVGNQSLMLVVGPELVQIPLYHIKTVKTAGIYASGGSKGSQGSRGSNNNGNNNNNGNKGNSSSGGNKSGGNNSGGNKSGGAKGNRNASAKGGRSSKSSKSGK